MLCGRPEEIIPSECTRILFEVEHACMVVRGETCETSSWIVAQQGAHGRPWAHMQLTIMHARRGSLIGAEFSDASRRVLRVRSNGAYVYASQVGLRESQESCRMNQVSA